MEKKVSNKRIILALFLILATVMLQIVVVHAEELCCEDHVGHACHDELRPCCAPLLCGNKGPGGIGMCA
ncbi:unnamed protein product [Amaranthus hypochondriacus]